jgi:hypothetical protein
VQQRHIHHGYLVDDDDIGIERGFGIALEERLARVPFQQPMDGLCRAAGGFGETLGGPSGGGAEKRALAPPVERVQDTADERRLAGAGAACDDEDARFERARDGAPLQRRQAKLRGGFERIDRGVDARAARPLRRREEAQDAASHGTFDAQHPRFVHRFFVALGVDDHGTLAGEPFDRRLGRCRLATEQTRRRLDQARARRVAVTVLGGLVERVQDTGLEALRGVERHAERLRDAIGREETDARDVARQSIRILAHDGDGTVTIAFVDARGVRGTDAVRLQEHHDVANAALFLPGRLDRRDAFGAQTRDLAQPRRFLVDDAQRVGAEVVDQLACHDRPDTAHQTRAEILLDADGRGRLDAQERLDAELAPVAAVVDPAAGHAQALARLHAGEVAHHREHRSRGLQTSHRPAGFVARIDDVLERAFERLRGVIRDEKRGGQQRYFRCGQDNARAVTPPRLHDASRRETASRPGAAAAACAEQGPAPRCDGELEDGQQHQTQRRCREREETAPGSYRCDRNEAESAHPGVAHHLVGLSSDRSQQEAEREMHHRAQRRLASRPGDRDPAASAAARPAIKMTTASGLRDRPQKTTIRALAHGWVSDAKASKNGGIRPATPSRKKFRQNGTGFFADGDATGLENALATSGTGAGPVGERAGASCEVAGASERARERRLRAIRSIIGLRAAIIVLLECSLTCGGHPHDLWPPHRPRGWFHPVALRRDRGGRQRDDRSIEGQHALRRRHRRIEQWRRDISIRRARRQFAARPHGIRRRRQRSRRFDDSERPIDDALLAAALLQSTPGPVHPAPRGRRMGRRHLERRRSRRYRCACDAGRCDLDSHVLQYDLLVRTRW